MQNLAATFFPGATRSSNSSTTSRQDSFGEAIPNSMRELDPSATIRVDRAASAHRSREGRSREGGSSEAISNSMRVPTPGKVSRPEGAAREGGAIAGSSQADGRRIMIAVCGMTGTGKSTFIQRLSGKQVKVGHGLYSQTYDPEEVQCTIDSRAVTLVDTPGFDDTTRTDAEVLQSLAEWLERTFVAGTLLSGIIYLHRITDVRMTHASLRNLKLFRKLCGDENLANVTLVTTWWEMCDPEIAVAREAELKSQGTFWGAMIAQGATTHRYDNKPAAAEDIVRKLLRNNPVSLKIQEQLVLQQRALVDTDAGNFVHEEMIKLEKRHQETLEVVKEEMERARKQSNEALKQELEQAHALALADLQKVQEAKVQLLEDKVSRIQLESKQELETQMAESNRKLQKSQQENQESMARMQSSHASQIAQVKSESTQAINSMKYQNDISIRDLENRNYQAMITVKNDYAAKLQTAAYETQQVKNKVDELERQKSSWMRQGSACDVCRVPVVSVGWSNYVKSHLWQCTQCGKYSWTNS